MNKRVNQISTRFPRNLFSRKRGVSTLIATVFIILLTVTAITILAAVIIPFARDNLDDKGGCLEVRDGIDIVTGEDTCYVDGGDTEIRVKLGNVDVDGIFISVNDPGSASYEIKENVQIPEVNNNALLSLPQKGGGEKTYIITTEYHDVSIGGIVNGKRCSITDSEELKVCL
jgi:hypothetical protein